MLVSPSWLFKSRTSVPLRAFLDARQLIAPVLLEPARPLVQRTNGAEVRAVQHLLSVSPDLNQTDVPKDPEVLGYGWLSQRHRNRDVPDGALLRHQVVEDV